jgi:xanthine dehydrogenase accessory factor
VDPHLLKQLNVERASRHAAILLTDLNDGRDRLIKESDVVAGPLGEAVAGAFRTGKSTTVEADGRQYFLNVHVPPARLVIIGAVHISQALAPMAAIAGFDVRVIDPRTAFATAERFTGIDLIAEWPDEALAERPLDAYTGLAAVTHDPKIDDDALRIALETGCFYVGALGSRKTHAKRVDRLRQAGVSDQTLLRIASPIGLDIGASSPAEIAVAILAELVAALRKRMVARS